MATFGFDRIHASQPSVPHKLRVRIAAISAQAGVALPTDGKIQIPVLDLALKRQGMSVEGRMLLKSELRAAGLID